MMAYSPAGSALMGYGGAGGIGGGFGLADNLSQQVKDETDDEKRKKRLGLSVLQSPAGRALIGGITPF